jgi:hypothetical protein
MSPHRKIDYGRRVFRDPGELPSHVRPKKYKKKNKKALSGAMADTPLTRTFPPEDGIADYGMY